MLPLASFRPAIMGCSASFATAIGQRLEWNEEGVLTAELELRDNATLYTRYGDWVARISTLVAVLALLYYMAYRIKRKNHLVD